MINYKREGDFVYESFRDEKFSCNNLFAYLKEKQYFCMLLNIKKEIINKKTGNNLKILKNGKFRFK
jgi:hypothetical protein